MPEQNDKIYPGSIEHYRSIRAQREALEASEDQTERERAVFVGVLEEMAGLSYILDGIRFSLRNTNTQGGGQ
jgi:hypothetical protein